MAQHIIADGIPARRQKARKSGASISKLMISWSTESSFSQASLSASSIEQNEPSNRPVTYQLNNDVFFHSDDFQTKS